MLYFTRQRNQTQSDGGDIAGVESIYQSRSDVRAMMNSDGGVLINLRTGRCFLLNHSGVLIWQMLVDGKSVNRIVEAAAEVDDSPVNLNRDHIRDFLKKLEGAQLLARNHSANANSVGKTSDTVHDQLRRSYRKKCIKDVVQKNFVRMMMPLEGEICLVVLALLGFLMADLVLAFVGFNAFYKIVKHWPIRDGLHANADATSQICCAINRACSCYFKRSWCLQRSAITTCMLRVWGIPAEMVIGCRTMPFAAHAWVEVNGCVIGEKKYFRKYFSVLERC